MIVRTTAASTSAGASYTEILPNLTPRERTDIFCAILDGDMVAVVAHGAQPGCSEIVGVLTPARAEQLCQFDGDRIGDLRAELQEAAKGLISLRDIARGVMTEKEPGDHLYRIESAIEYVQEALKGAIDHADFL